MKCDICGVDYAERWSRGVKTKIVLYEEKQGKFTKKWRIVKRRKKIFMCKPCVDMFKGLIVSYRRNSR